MGGARTAEGRRLPGTLAAAGASPGLRGASLRLISRPRRSFLPGSSPGRLGLRLLLLLLGLQTAVARGATAHCDPLDTPYHDREHYCRAGVRTQTSGQACELVRVYAMRVRGVVKATEVPSLRPRTVARGGGGDARANSRSWRQRTAPWLIPERPVIGRRPPLCKGAEGMEFLGPGLQ